MTKLKKSIITQIREHRSNGQTYSEINQLLNLSVSKSTLSYWCSTVAMPDSYQEKVKSLNVSNLEKARKFALKANKIKRGKYLSAIDKKNDKLSQLIANHEIAKVALAMLCLGEASKYGKSSFALGSSDPKIIVIFLQLLKMRTDFNSSKIRCTVQCRADQNVEELEKYWMEITNISADLFYKAQIDPRTVGKPTKKANYKGVLRVNYLDANVQLELESLAFLIYNQLLKRGPVV